MGSGRGGLSDPFSLLFTVGFPQVTASRGNFFLNFVLQSTFKIVTIIMLVMWF